MSNDAFQALCRCYQAAFAELVPRVDAAGDKAVEARVVRVCRVRVRRLVYI